MPNRILRDGILSSERVARLGWAEEVFYRRLMSVVDDFGRYYATPMLLRAACYPLMLDKVSDADVGKWLAKCAEAALVSVYPAQDGKRYLQMLDFRQQVRAKDSKFPQPLSTCVADAQQTPSTSEASAHLVVDVDVSGGVDDLAPQASPKARGSRLPSDWVLSDEWLHEGERARADADLPAVDLRLEAAKFRDFWCAKSGKDATKADWLATWRNWCRNARGVNGYAPAKPSRLSTPTAADHEAAGSNW